MENLDNIFNQIISTYNILANKPDPNIEKELIKMIKKYEYKK